MGVLPPLRYNDGIVGARPTKREKRPGGDPGRPRTICIFGLSSMVGSGLAEFFRRDFRVVGTYHKNRVHMPGVLALPCNVLAKGEVQSILHAFKPDYTVYAVGLSSLEACHENEQLAEALNTMGFFHVTEACQRYKSQICYVSSAFVFQGGSKRYLEVDMPDAVTVLGKTQAVSEFYIQKSPLNCLVFRCCRLYGRAINPMTPSGFFEMVERSVDLGEKAGYDDDLLAGFLDVHYLGMVMKMCFDGGIVNRLLHVSSKDAATHLGFVRAYCDVFERSGDNAAGIKWPFPVIKNQEAPKVPSFRLNVANAEGFLDIRFPSVRESLEFTRKRLRGRSSETSGDPVPPPAGAPGPSARS